MENLQKKPSKGILKSSSSFEQQSECQPQPKQETSAADKDIKWDEMNILQTLHPADKDYGHMKIEEPKTPYNYYDETTDGPIDVKNLDAEALAAKFAERAAELPSVMRQSSGEESEEDYENLTEEEKKKRREFEVKRKMHYNEFQAVKLARKLLEQEEEEDDDEANKESAQPEQSADTDDTDEQRNGNRMAANQSVSDEPNEDDSHTK